MKKQTLPGTVAEIEHHGKRVKYFAPNDTTRWRVETLMTKEPDTIAWIERLEPGAVLYDVGANVGLYTIWAAVTRGVRVYAFEPESQNYAILNTNVLLNELHEQVSAYCVAISDAMSFDHLHLSGFLPGGSLHNFGEARDYHDRPVRSEFRQGSVGVSLDELIERFGLPAPAYLKIDVDGIEPKIIRGARKLIAGTALKSVVVEVNTHLDEHWKIIDTMLEAGFDYAAEQVERSVRSDGPFKGIGNYVFSR